MYPLGSRAPRDFVYLFNNSMNREEQKAKDIIRDDRRKLTQVKKVIKSLNVMPGTSTP